MLGEVPDAAWFQAGSEVYVMPQHLSHWSAKEAGFCTRSYPFGMWGHLNFQELPSLFKDKRGWRPWASHLKVTEKPWLWNARLLLIDSEFRKRILSSKGRLLILQTSVQGIGTPFLITGHPSRKPLLLWSFFTRKKHPSTITLLITILVSLSPPAHRAPC